MCACPGRGNAVSKRAFGYHMLGKRWPWLSKSEVLPLWTFLVTGLSLEHTFEA